jgi:hypothetical protein
MSLPEFGPLEGHSPHLSKWDEYDLEADYEHIQPDSAVGRIAVELREQLITTAIDRDDWEQSCQDDLAQEVYADDIQAADEAAEIAEARHTVFARMYFDLDGILTQMLCGYNRYGSYEEAVDAALQRGLRELDRTYIPEGSQAELERLNHEIAMFLTLEGPMHFEGVI